MQTNSKNKNSNHSFLLADANFTEPIWTSGTRLGTGKLRWCGTDKPLNVFWNWTMNFDNYDTSDNFLAFKYRLKGYTGEIVVDTKVYTALCEQN
jgi:hypothetical protein